MTIFVERLLIEWRDMELTADQQQAADQLVNFLLSQENEILCSGAPGVGKSHLISWFVNEGYSRYIQVCRERGLLTKYVDEPIVTATTNKAAEVLRTKLGKDVRTIHSYLGLVVKEDYNNGGTHIVNGKKFGFKYQKVLFIDECSMIDYGLYDYIQKACIDCKIIYVGDKDQLAPVNCPNSPVFTKKGMSVIQLTTNVRLSQHPELLALADQLRETVNSKIFYPINPIPGVVEYLSGQQFQEKINELFKVPNPNNKLVTYTNQRALAYNEYIKYDLRKYEAPYVKGERYLVNSALVHSIEGSEEKEVILATDTVITVDEVLNEDVVIIKDEVIQVINLIIVKEEDAIPIHICAPYSSFRYLQLLKKLAKNKNWKEYFGLKEKIADLRLADCSTVHKAQGSTYQNIFIDLNDLGECRAYTTAARLLYVACTRATDHVYLYGNLPDRLGGMPSEDLLLSSS